VINLLENLLAGQEVRLGRLGLFRFEQGRLKRRGLTVDPDVTSRSRLGWLDAETLPLAAVLRLLARQAPPGLPYRGGSPRRVVVESPYSGDRARNERYLVACMRDCIGRGEAPYASHRMFTSALDDNDPRERELGIRLGLEWGRAAHATVVYTDLGISSGMATGIASARMAGRLVESRVLGGAWASSPPEAIR